MSDTNMAMVLAAMKSAGLNDNQARIMAAEVGRENAFQDKYLWGYHSDPRNHATNVGFLSWQGARGKGVEAALRNAGLLRNGKIVKGQQSLNIMAKYMVDEIRTNPAYAQTRKLFLENPNVDYHTGAKVLGTNYIRWRYNDPNYSAGHKNRDNFYTALGGILPTVGRPVPQQYVSNPQPLLPEQPTMQVSQTPVSLFPPVPNNGFDVLATVGGLDAFNTITGGNLAVPFLSKG